MTRRSQLRALAESECGSTDREAVIDTLLAWVEAMIDLCHSDVSAGYIRRPPRLPAVVRLKGRDTTDAFE